jgi:hypothetical protein
MLCFPNGLHDLQLYYDYAAAFQRFCDNMITLDYIVPATVDVNLATSLGYMGKKVIARSTRDDRSRGEI